MDKIKTIFIGGLTNGRIVLEYLMGNKYTEVPLIITYPPDLIPPRSVNISKSAGNAELIYDLNADKHVDKIASHFPDFVLVAGWSGLLSEELINLPGKGTVGFHPSKLPRDRGRSVLAWQIEEGYSETSLTMFYYNKFPDSGDIIAQESIKIEHNDYINDLLDKVDEATYNLMKSYYPLIRRGIAPRRPQDYNEGNFRRLRTERDSLINWNRNAFVIYNKIRAISKPYPGAYFLRDGKKIRVWRSKIVDQEDIESAHADSKPGDIIVKVGDFEYIMRCRDKFLKIST